MAKRYYETDNKQFYLVVDEEKIEIKQRMPDKFYTSKTRIVWKVYIPGKENFSPWNCVNYLAYKRGPFEYKQSHLAYIPACDLQSLKLELEKRLAINLPQKAFDKFEAITMANALIGTV